MHLLDIIEQLLEIIGNLIYKMHTGADACISAEFIYICNSLKIFKKR